MGTDIIYVQCTFTGFIRYMVQNLKNVKSLLVTTFSQGYSSVDLRVFISIMDSKDQITHSAPEKLLHILQSYHPELPVDARAFQGTGKETNVNVIDGGSWNHFGGVTDKIKSKLCLLL